MTQDDLHSQSKFPDAASAEEQEEALSRLASLPHFRQLEDGTLFDYLRGIQVKRCRCEEYSPFHLLVSYGKGHRNKIGLVSREALAQFVVVQEAVAATVESALALKRGEAQGLG